MKKFIVLFFLVLSVITCQNVSAENITATGVGVTHNEAMNDALRNAVETAVGVLIDSKTMVDKNVVLEDKIYAVSKGFISKYDVIESEEDTNGWRVVINAEVDLHPESQLMDELTKLGLIDNKLRNPKIAVLIPSDFTAETAVVKAFNDAGFDNMLDIGRYRSEYSNAFNLNSEKLHLVAQSMQADILVVGNATCENIGDIGKFLPGKKKTGTLSCRICLDAKMYVEATGQIIASGSKDGAAVDSSVEVAAQKASKVAGKEMGTYLSSKLLELAAGNRQRIEVIVVGAGYDKIMAVENALHKIKDVKNINLAYKDGRGTYSMNYAGSPQTLFAQIESNIECHVELRSSSYNRLMIAVW